MEEKTETEKGERGEERKEKVEKEDGETDGRGETERERDKHLE